VLHRPLVVLGAVLAALALAAPALAVRVHIRVEGASTTIFGATERVVTPATGVIHPPEGPDVTVTGATPLGALERASRIAELYYRVIAFSNGAYVAQIGRYSEGGDAGWGFRVNGKEPPVGSDAYRLKSGDRVLWYFAHFSAGSPKTLRLRAVRRCYEARSIDPNGNAAVEKDVTFVVNSRRRVADADGMFCPKGKWKRLRVVKHGLIRSQVVLH
jgi:uncharacterized protein DUF4430